jgi:hypothetical protein
MTISMYKASAPIFVQFLTSLSAVLDKAAAHAEAKKIDPAVLLDARLYSDMFPLVRQVREATNHAASACGRLARADLLTFTNTEASIPGPPCARPRLRGSLASLHPRRPVSVSRGYRGTPARQWNGAADRGAHPLLMKQRSLGLTIGTTNCSI